MIDVLYFSDKAVKQKLFDRVAAAKRLTLVTVLPPHRAGSDARTLEPHASLERDFGELLDQVLVADEGKVEGMWRDPVVDLADSLFPDDAKAAYAAARGYLFIEGGAPKLTVKKSNDHDADLQRLEKEIERMVMKRKPGAPPPPPPKAKQASRTWDETRTVEEAPAVTLDPWTVLGIPKGAPVEEARKAWKALITQYHPDKVAHLAPEFRSLAEEKTRQIMTAWEQVRGTAVDE